MELLNVIDYQSYWVKTNDSNDNSDLWADPGLLALLLLQYVDARAKSHQLLHFFFSNFEMIDDSRVAVDGPKDLYYPFFVQHIAALFSMKKNDTTKASEELGTVPSINSTCVRGPLQAWQVRVLFFATEIACGIFVYL